jgi:hypothetical protein
MPGPGHGEKYTRLRESAIVSMLAHPTIGDAARAVGISEKALRNWSSRPDFVESVRLLRQQILSQGVTRLTALVSDAVETLRLALKSKKAADRVRAARSILEFQQRLHEGRLEDRVAELEKELAARKQQANVTINGGIVNQFASLSPEALRSFIADRKPKNDVQVIEHVPSHGESQQ